MNKEVKSSSIVAGVATDSSRTITLVNYELFKSLKN